MASGGKWMTASPFHRPAQMKSEMLVTGCTSRSPRLGVWPSAIASIPLMRPGKLKACTLGPPARLAKGERDARPPLAF